MENVKVETPVAPVAPVATTPTPTAAPTPGTPEFAAWAWENRGA